MSIPHTIAPLLITLSLALTVTGCAGPMSGTSMKTTVASPAIYMEDRPASMPTVMFIGMPQQIIGHERPDIVLDGWN